MKLSQPFPHSIKPVHEGVYQTITLNRTWNDYYFNYFCVEAGIWYASACDPESAELKFKEKVPSSIQVFDWRGVLK